MKKSFLFALFFVLAMGLSFQGGTIVDLSGKAYAGSKKEKKKDHEGADAGHSKGGHYVQMEPLMLPVIDGNGISQMINLVIVVEVNAEKYVDQVKEMEPKIQDAYIQSMYGLLSKKAALKGGIIQIRVIKESLKDITVALVGDDIVQDVLLQVVEQRRI